MHHLLGTQGDHLQNNITKTEDAIKARECLPPDVVEYIDHVFAKNIFENEASDPQLELDNEALANDQEDITLVTENLCTFRIHTGSYKINLKSFMP